MFVALNLVKMEVFVFPKGTHILVIACKAIMAKTAKQVKNCFNLNFIVYYYINIVIMGNIIGIIKASLGRKVHKH